ncbi:ATP-binding protein [Pseudonocardia sp. WMMC193]|uniref:sensor histidine kinase n=1 Tax=Pseudonocardia sp. WMMC193 TaxID=2911965 RepID=UPI001F2711D5|nr:ATP-binding protein [Pseudonocardia sp. WMMC193]MCF7553411.1 ATP-binding protein [Pseudonocardia sp. WMMC193]
MRRRRAVRGSRRPLARQFLVWQLVVVVILLAAVAALAAVQSHSAFEETQGRRMLSVAEDVAATPGIRAGLVERNVDLLASFARSAENLSGADRVVVVDAGRVVRSSPDPAELGTAFEVGESTAFAGRAWTGEQGRSVVAEVPVVVEGGEVVGVVSAGIRAPTLFEALAPARGEVAALLGLALVLGVGGSLLLARRVRRQTLGLEPAEIVELVQRREAMLLGVKEGVVGLDGGKVTLINPAAHALLGLRVGDALDGLDARLRDVLTGAVRGEDQVVVHGGRVLVLNRNELDAGAVVTLRDRTELAALQDRLDASRSLTDTLRAQAHEFTNRLHTIAGLTELGEHDEVRRFVSGVVAAAEGWRREVVDRVAEPAVAALLVAKASLAQERGVELRFAAGAHLDASGDPALGGDLVTVLGNLVDNALDAVSGRGPDGWVEIDIAEREGAVHVRVRDSGPGVASDLAEEVFRHGFTTKAAESPGGRGLGLALVREVCLRRSGSVAVSGSTFTAVLA